MKIESLKKRLSVYKQSLKNLVSLFSYKLRGSKILIIQAAAGLGDYLWIRNYLPLIKADPQYKDYKLILCCTERWLDFAKEMDEKYIDIFLPFKSPYNPKYREKFPLLYIKFDILINFHTYYVWKNLNESIKSKRTFLIDIVPPDIMKMFYDTRNNVFMSNIVQLPQNFQHTLPVKKICDRPKVVTLALRGYSQGKLSMEQVEFIIKKLSSEFSHDILLLGEKSDFPTYEEMLSRSPSLSKRLICGCGNFSQTELIDVIENSFFVITPDTSIFHMALQLKKDILCLSNFNGVSHYDDTKVCHLRANTMQDISKEMLSDGIMQIKYQLVRKDKTVTISDI